jgi:hypothetical protein
MMKLIVAFRNVFRARLKLCVEDRVQWFVPVDTAMSYEVLLQAQLAERLSYYGLFEWTVGSRKHQQQL